MSLLKAYLPEFLRDITMLGGSVFYLLLVIIVLVTGQIVLAVKLIAGFFLTFAVIIGFRFIYFKPRPAKENYHTFAEKIEASSFPSWHAARSFFVVLTLGMGSNALMLAFLLLLAALVCYSRIYLKKHDWIDVGGGVILGVMTYFIIGFLWYSKLP